VLFVYYRSLYPILKFLSRFRCVTGSVLWRIQSPLGSGIRATRRLVQFCRRRPAGVDRSSRDAQCTHGGGFSFLGCAPMDRLCCCPGHYVIPHFIWARPGPRVAHRRSIAAAGTATPLYGLLLPAWWYIEATLSATLFQRVTAPQTHYKTEKGIH